MTAQGEAKSPAPAAVKKEIAPRPTRNWRARLFQGYLVAAVVVFAVLLVGASQFDYFPIDLTITRGVQFFNAGWFGILMGAVSYIGYSPQVWVLVVVIVVLMYVFGLRWEAVVAGLAAAAAAGVVTLIKLIVHRPRPGAELVTVVQELGSSSFPSGHVMHYTVFFGFLFFLMFTLFKPSAARTVLLVTLGSLIALVGISRIYLGNHWASDVTAAYLLGSVLLTATVSTYRWGKKRFFVEQPLAPDAPATAGAK